MISEINANPDLREPAVEISEGKPEDLAEIAAVLRSAWMDTYPSKELGITAEYIEHEDLDAVERETIEKRFLGHPDPDRRLIVARVDGKIVGFCSAFKTSRDVYISSMYVHPASQRLGVGRQMMQNTLSWFGEQPDVYLNVAIHNQKAIDFYRQFGFEDTDIRIEFATTPSGKGIPAKIMRKPGHPEKP